MIYYDHWRVLEPESQNDPEWRSAVAVLHVDTLLIPTLQRESS
jgi:hypothetical protein